MWYVGGRFAVGAQPAGQALSCDENNAGSNIERGDPHIAHARQSGGGIIGVKR